MTTGLWLVATAGLHLYLRLVGSAARCWRAFGGGVMVMIWVYLLSLALLLGGELSAVLVQARRRSGAHETSSATGLGVRVCRKNAPMVPASVAKTTTE